MKEKKYLVIGSLFLILFLGIGAGYSLAKVELGGEIRMRFEGINNSDYDDELADNCTFSTQRTRVYFRGDLAENVLFDLGVQSNGYWGGSSPAGLDENYNYWGEKDGLNPWALYLENAYLKFIQIEKKPIDVFVGRQPICYGDGLVLDDSNRGFDALRAVWRLPANLEWEALTVKGRETGSLIDKENGDAGGELESKKYVDDGKDANVYGTVFRWLPIRKKMECYLIYEVDKSTDNAVLRNKYFYGIRLEEKMKEGIDYKIEFGMKKADGKDIFDYDGYALQAGVMGYTRTAYLGAVSAKVEYFQATGSEDEQDKKNFNPAYARTSNNYGECYYGEYYSEVSPGLTNKKITNFGIGVSPSKKTSINLDYYIFDSWTKTINGVSDLGEEIDVILFYRYSPQVKLRFVYAIFLPGEASANEGTSASKILGEILVRF
ncbi:alginate export family protein [bacterium]|nr:alginate export family protein [bacterium]